MTYPSNKSKTPRYRSKFEAKVALGLPKGTRYENAKLMYTLTKNYFPDWQLPNGRFLEGKGRFTSADRTKMLAVKSAHPDVDIRIVFMNPNVKLSKISKTTYGAWATKNGFIWCHGPKVPKSWFR